jgi:hypothetical protein
MSPTRWPKRIAARPGTPELNEEAHHHRPCRRPLKSLRFLENSENNSELLQMVRRRRAEGPAISAACGKIPCAAEQGSRFVLTGKSFAKISEFAESEQGISEFGREADADSARASADPKVEHGSFTRKAGDGPTHCNEQVHGGGRRANRAPALHAGLR